MDLEQFYSIRIQQTSTRTVPGSANLRTCNKLCIKDFICCRAKLLLGRKGSTGYHIRSKNVQKVPHWTSVHDLYRPQTSNQTIRFATSNLSNRAARIQRWSLYQSNFNYQVEYRKNTTTLMLMLSHVYFCQVRNLLWRNYQMFSQYKYLWSSQLRSTLSNAKWNPSWSDFL